MCACDFQVIHQRNAIVRVLGGAERRLHRNAFAVSSAVLGDKLALGKRWLTHERRKSVRHKGRMQKQNWFASATYAAHKRRFAFRPSVALAVLARKPRQR